MNSHEYAAQLEEFAAQLKSTPAFEVPEGHELSLKSFWYFLDKDRFLAAVKALGPGKKDLESLEYVMFHPDILPGVRIKVEKSKLCRMVKPAEYECDSWMEQFESVK